MDRVAAAAAHHLSRLLTGNALSQPIAVAATLGVADLVEDGPRTVADLAQATETHADSLHRLLRALATLGVLVETEPGRFGLGELGHPLRSNAPHSLRAVAILAGEAWRAASFELLHSVRTGGSGFEKRFGVPMYRYFETHPEAGANFNAVQAAHAGAIDLAAAVDFAGAGTVVDVGGGTGGVLLQLLAARPELAGVIFDLPPVAAEAEALVAARGLGARCRVVGGDFFTRVPSGGDVYLLCFVLHNWDDAGAARILEHTAAAMVPGARVVIVESLLSPSGPSASHTALLDLEMLVFTSGGRERSEAEYRGLLAAAGFGAPRVHPTPTTASILEARRL